MASAAYRQPMTTLEVCRLVRHMQAGLTDYLDPSWNGRTTLLTLWLVLDNYNEEFHLFLLQRVDSVLRAMRNDSSENAISLKSPFGFDIMNLTPCVWLMSAWTVYMVCKAAGVDLTTVNNMTAGRSWRKAPYLHRPIFFPGWLGTQRVTAHCGWQQMAGAVALLFDWRQLLGGVDPNTPVPELQLISRIPHATKAWLIHTCLEEDRRGITTFYVSPLFLTFSSNDWRVMLPKLHGPEPQLLLHIMGEKSRRGRLRDGAGAYTELSRGFGMRLTDHKSVGDESLRFPNRVDMKRCLDPSNTKISVNRTCEFDKVNLPDQPASLQQHRAVASAVFGLTRLPSQVCRSLCGFEHVGDMTADAMLVCISELNLHLAKRQEAWARARIVLLEAWAELDEGVGDLAQVVSYIMK